MRTAIACSVFVSLAGCAAQPKAPPPVERTLVLLLPAQQVGTELSAGELEGVRRAVGDFLRNNETVPIRVVSDLELAAVSSKYRDDPNKCGTIEDAWRRQYPDAAPAVALATCEAGACRVEVSAAGTVFANEVVEASDAGAWVAAVGGLKKSTGPGPAVPTDPPVTCEAEN